MTHESTVLGSGDRCGESQREALEGPPDLDACSLARERRAVGIVGDTLEGPPQTPRLLGEPGAARHQREGPTPRPAPGEQDRGRDPHRDGERTDRDGARVPPEMTLPIGHVVPAAVQLHHDHVEPPAHVGDLVAERAHAAARAIVFDYASRSLAHCMSSFTVFRVTASGAPTLRFHPTSASKPPIASKSTATPRAASQPGIQIVSANTAETRSMVTPNTATTPAATSSFTMSSSALRSALSSARASSTSFLTRSEIVSSSRVSSWRVESDWVSKSMGAG